MKIDIYLDGSYKKQINHISVGYCIVNDRRKVIYEFGMTVGFSDYRKYIEKLGANFVEVLALCKVLEKIIKNKDEFKNSKIVLHTESAFTVYISSLIKKYGVANKFLIDYIIIHPFLNIIKRAFSLFENLEVKRSKSSLSKAVISNKNEKTKDQDSIPLKKSINIKNKNILMPPLGESYREIKNINNEIFVIDNKEIITININELN